MKQRTEKLTCIAETKANRFGEWYRKYGSFRRAGKELAEVSQGKKIT